MAHLTTEAFEAICNLRLLHVDNVRFEVCNLKNLRKLELDDTAIQGVPNCIGSLEKLEVLSMAGCTELEALLPSIRLLKNLKRLSASGDEYTCSSLKELPEDIGELNNLIYLDISYNPDLAVVPSSFFNLSSLEILKAADCNWIQRVDIDSLGKLSSLKELDLRFSDSFCSLPSCIGVLPQLERLDVECCESLQFLPQLPPSLVRLSARCCSALEMMSDISNLKGLQELDLSGCEKLIDIPGLENLGYLKVVKLGRCRSLSDTQRYKIKEAGFRHLSEFSISGSPTLGRSLDARLLSFFLHKRLKCVSLYLEISGNFEDGEGIGVHVDVVNNHYTISETVSQVALCRDPLKLGRNEPGLIKLQENERTKGYAENDHGIMHVSIDRGLLMGADVKLGADESFADSYIEYLQHGNYSFYRYEAMDISVDGSSQNTRWYCRLVFEQQLDWSRLHHPEGCWRHL
ncbi:Disease resistance protein [Nymphaea thermarum]|nr:Disease resistance protein [Nymphaea thermarum]